jgi:hypothetical protein
VTEENQEVKNKTGSDVVLCRLAVCTVAKVARDPYGQPSLKRFLYVNQIITSSTS